MSSVFSPSAIAQRQEQIRIAAEAFGRQYASVLSMQVLSQQAHEQNMQLERQKTENLKLLQANKARGQNVEQKELGESARL
jgi:catechol-2,3-dioxygenase